MKMEKRGNEIEEKIKKDQIKAGQIKQQIKSTSNIGKQDKIHLKHIDTNLFS